MIFSYNWLQEYIKGSLPRPEKLAELLTMKAFEVSEVKRNGKDWVLDIDVLPNRAPDCFSHMGIAREVAVTTNQKYIGDTYVFPKLKEDKKLKTKDFVSVEVKDKQACPRYTAGVLCNVKVGPSPKWIQERLRICGLRPINNIVDMANYVMLETGQPLHAFDFEKISGVQNQKSKRTLRGASSKNQKCPLFTRSRLKIKNIIIRKAKKEEKITTLDDEKYNLDEDILVIADQKDPLAIAGIKGGKKAEIDKGTKTVILESANFESRTIRRASKKLGLKTHSSLRFEHGIDPNLTEIAINRAAYLIQKIAGGKITQGLVDVYPKKVLPKRIRFDLDYVKSLLGIEISKKEIKKILSSLGIKVHEKTSREIEVGVPTRRLDITLTEDLIEEIGRIYGYQKIPPTLPVTVLIPPKRNLDIFWENMAKNILKEAGFTETYNYSFISQKDAEIFDLKVIEVENPTSLDFKYLRPSLIPNLLKNVQKNQKHFNEIKIFELGEIFGKQQTTSNKKQELEKRMLTGAITGEAFYQAKGVIDLLLNKLGISNIWYDDYQPTPEDSKKPLWHLKKCAEIKVNHKEIGFLGEISPRIIDSLNLKSKIVVFDIDFEILSKLVSEEQEYRPISRFPSAVRDIAVLVPGVVRVEEVLNKIEEVAGKLIRDIDLFDIYEGEELPRGKKNLAFHIIYQSEDRTLFSKEVDEIQNKIIKTLEKEPGWQVRK